MKPADEVELERFTGHNSQKRLYRFTNSISSFYKSMLQDPLERTTNPCGRVRQPANSRFSGCRFTYIGGAKNSFWQVQLIDLCKISSLTSARWSSPGGEGKIRPEVEGREAWNEFKVASLPHASNPEISPLPRDPETEQTGLYIGPGIPFSVSGKTKSNYHLSMGNTNGSLTGYQQGTNRPRNILQSMLD